MNIEPSTQKKLFGLNKIFDTLKNLHDKNKLPNKILLSGEKGIGKSTLAFHFINSILSNDEEFSYNFENNEINSKNKSYLLLQNKSNPNFHLIDILKDKKNIDIEQIRELIMSLNKSSFNFKKRFVLIDNIEFLNKNSINALLKIIEEPNDNIYFILINHNQKILDTLKSRCLDFKITLSKNKSIEIINEILNDNVFNLLNNDFLNHYSTPGTILKIIDFSNIYKIDLKSMNLKDFLILIIKNKIYKKTKLDKEIIYYFIELYFRNNISINNIDLLKLYKYFLKKINNTITYNLDEEVIFMEFEEKVLNG